MTRSLDFGQAMAYPFRQGNRMNTLFWPGVIIWVALIILYGANLLISMMFLPSLASASPGTVPPEFMLTQFAVQTVLQTLFFPFLMGYGWEVVHTLRHEGYDAAAPAWSFDKVPAYWWDGFKLIIWSYIISVPYFLAIFPPLMDNDTVWLCLIALAYMMVMLFIAPLFWSAIIQATETRGFFDLVNFPRILHAARQCYFKALLANVVIFVCALVSIPVMLIGCCLLGVGYAATVAWLTFFMIHMLTQAFDAYREPPPAKKGYKRP